MQPDSNCLGSIPGFRNLIGFELLLQDTYMERKYYMYQITNKLDGKVYIGVHQTNDLDDGYMGSGIHLKRAQKKYGIENFEKEIIKIFDSQDGMFKEEAILVDAEFVARKDTYNMTEGGRGGSITASIKGGQISGPKVGNYLYKNNLGIFSKEAKENSRKYRISEENLNCLLNNSKVIAESEEIKAKRKATMRKNKHGQGKNNSQYGKMWITNGIDNTRINKEDSIPTGWKKGRSTKNIEYKCGKESSSYGKIWITDGIVSKSISKEEQIPTGWKRGRTIKNKYNMPD